MDAEVVIKGGEMLGAFRNCGKMSAASWIEPGHDGVEFTARCENRGDTVRRLTVKPGDSFPEWICRSQCDDCLKTPNV